MTDFFALFDEPRRPWLEPEPLKQKFLSRSAELHPDHCANSPQAVAATVAFTQLNAAYKCLSNPRARLQHLLELETGARPQQIETVPPELLNTFFEIGQACRQADVVLSRKSAADSPLLQLQQFEASQTCVDKLMELQKQAASRIEELLVQLRRLDADWNRQPTPQGSQRAKIMEALAEIYRLLGYFEKWTNQIRERILQLSL